MAGVGGSSHDHGTPPRSPDLSMYDFFLWGDLKANLFEEKPRMYSERMKELKAAIRNRTALINKQLLLSRVDEGF